ncbi:MAG: hypothetical protein HY520_04930 [Candidatus Aenigmarchaeota archaeon]|nr:hypothetical protein [Candidatus Aenigmarchaeota archaeon]
MVHVPTVGDGRHYAFLGLIVIAGYVAGSRGVVEGMIFLSFGFMLLMLFWLMGKVMEDKQQKKPL